MRMDLMEENILNKSLQNNKHDRCQAIWFIERIDRGSVGNKSINSIIVASFRTISYGMLYVIDLMINDL